MRLYRVPELMARRAVAEEAAVYEVITEGTYVDAGTVWPALHYVLCFEAPMPRHIALQRDVEWEDDSLENVLMGGEATPYADQLTVARVLMPEAVRVLAAQLRELTPAVIEGRIDDSVDEYLPAEVGANDKVSVIVEAFGRVAECFGEAAAAGEGILLYVP